ncbi:hypothetical protein [Actinomadura rubrisoli]|uniref:DUF1579 domain-containing protein n=1 Tax=Actinomadura rubrisoli TaxID=2530368 RepID=A0A4R5BZR3_9ACTN|nr:hypothetical protein [Actinomadura rubrisoli]TDD91709.1 hypothetical protein E1298_11580 [Actinomadura rubrisoli]
MTPLPPNPALKPLEALIGEWAVSVPEFPGSRGYTVFEWLEGGAFLRLHSEAPDPAPSATLVISRDDTTEDYTILHYDSRGVSRVYAMSFDDRVWKIWRQAPGFHQRFSGSMADDGSSISGAWEKSPDGSSWEHDFTLIYTRLPESHP